MYSVAAFSSALISDKDLAELMRYLNATFDVDSEAWVIRHRGVEVLIRRAPDVEDQRPDLMPPIEELLGAYPRSRVNLSYGLGFDPAICDRIVRAVAIAMAERWPVVLDDHTDNPESIDPPGTRRSPG